MQQRTIISKGRRFLVNTATADDGVGAGFATGQLVMKSATDGMWYVVTATGASPTAAVTVSQSALPYASGWEIKQNEVTSSFLPAPSYYEQNFPYQIVASNNGLAYAVYLTGTAPTVTVVVSQSAWGPSYVTNSLNAVIDIAKPYLLLQSVTDGNYYCAGLTTTLGVTTLVVNQNMVSQSWVHPIY